MFNFYNSYIWDAVPKKKKAKYQNVLSFRRWYFYLANLFLNRFEFKGMPETVNTRFLFEVLFCNGNALFFKDPNNGAFMALPVSPAGKQNVYYEYTQYRAVSINYSKEFDADKCVLMRSNELMFPPIQYIIGYAERISDAERTIDVYSKTMKRPWLVTCDKDDNMTMKVTVDKIEGNEIVVAGDRRLGEQLTRAYNNPLDGNGLSALWDNKHQLINEALTLIGINNANNDKRERLITDEVNANNQQTIFNAYIYLDWLKKSCDEINKKFGLNVSVDFKHNEMEVNKNAVEETTGNSQG